MVTYTSGFFLSLASCPILAAISGGHGGPENSVLSKQAGHCTLSCACRSAQLAINSTRSSQASFRSITITVRG